MATLKDKTMNLELSELWDYLGTASGLANNDEDYKRFYHNINGEKVRHDKVHNLYGYNMTRAAAEAFDEVAPDKEILLFSRSSYIGRHMDRRQQFFLQSYRTFASPASKFKYVWIFVCWSRYGRFCI